MTLEDQYRQAKNLLAEYVGEWVEPEADRLDATVLSDKLIMAVQSLVDNQWGYLATITGLDGGQDSGILESLYHFCAGNAVLTLRVPLDRAHPEVPSICGVVVYASPFERESGEMFGITYTNTPDTSRLFLPDDWEEGVYPLRKDVTFGELNDEHIR